MKVIKEGKIRRGAFWNEHLHCNRCQAVIQLDLAEDGLAIFKQYFLKDENLKSHFGVVCPTQNCGAIIPIN